MGQWECGQSGTPERNESPPAPYTFPCPIPVLPSVLGSGPASTFSLVDSGSGCPGWEGWLCPASPLLP